MSTEKVAIIAVVGHDYGGNKGLGLRLRVVWEDNISSYESVGRFVKENWWQAYEYASRNNLLSQKGFGLLRPRKGFESRRNVSVETYEGYLELDLESTPDRDGLRLSQYKAAMIQKAKVLQDLQRR